MVSALASSTVELLGEYAARLVRHQDLAGLGSGGEARGEIHRVTGHSVLAVAGTAGAARNDLPTGNANVNADLATNARRYLRYRSLYGQRGSRGPLGIVAVRNRCAKDPHDTVADVLVDVSTVLVDRAVGTIEKLLKQGVHFLGVELLTPRGVAGKIGEQHSHLPPLASHIGP